MPVRSRSRRAAPVAFVPAGLQQTRTRPRIVTAPVTPSLVETPLRPSHTVPTPVAALAALVEAPVRGFPADTSDQTASDQTMVTGVTLRAQQTLPGDLFVGLPSLIPGRAHGADFAGVACSAGAVAVLTDPLGAHRPALAAAIARRPGIPVLVHADPRSVLGTLSARIYGDPSTALSVLGITGTAGKTTTAYLLEAGLRVAGAPTGLLGTVAVRIGEALLPSTFTTPEAPQLQALLALMVERGVTHVPIEVSSHALALGRVSGTTFAVGAFTNLSQDHLDFHADLEDYFAAKAMLFDGRASAEVVCIDDDWGQRLVTGKTTTVSLSGEAIWRATEITAQHSGSQTFRALGPDGFDQRLGVRLPGAFNVTNALLALAVGHAAGADPVLLARGIATAEVPGRMQRVDRGQGFVALVDYAHKPAAVAALLDAVRAQVPGRLLVVLGCGGDRDTAKRPLMGAQAASRADLLVITDDNPRTEDPAAIRAAMLTGAAAGPAEVVEIGDRAQAIAYAVTQARPGDAVVVAGKGHESAQEVHGVKRPFVDADVLTDLLDGWIHD
ncbi:MAG: UDP-N-acetylmuramoyl-L-alanyl-D-glutamate--2,6-diaminopimelate ligase [Pseudonocardiales bacterium]|nr:UDP-N-acetylmuramoyl-L-alanyl-D-glutamate--2,6-diaminopimelate ligase [Pseudonocardiales bacterium]